MDKIIAGSFRDPSGFLFERENTLYRQINKVFQEHYESFISSGLYDELIAKQLLIPHEEVQVPFARPDTGYKVIQPERVPFISYPYEWCFSQLKDAALTTLKIQQIAFDKKMILKDASAYNIQFSKGKPILIDTLSFEKHKEGEPWVAYQQFCRHFLAPLALSSKMDARLGQLLRTNIDGIPLDLGVSLLPNSSRFNISLVIHLYLHARSLKKYECKTLKKSDRKISRLAFRGIIDSLTTAVKKLQLHPYRTPWGDYSGEGSYSNEAFVKKKEIISKYIERIHPKEVWDIGANTGTFSRLSSNKGIPTIAFDMDAVAVEKNYRTLKEKNETAILPLLMDITNPSPGIGWENQERCSLFDRGPAEMVVALALIHHLCISNNVPLKKVAHLFSRLCDYLIIEFIPKEDPKVKQLLSTRADIFDEYDQFNFEKSFGEYFTILQNQQIKDSSRCLYLLKKNLNPPTKANRI